jgi:hypothetical protein
MAVDTMRLRSTTGTMCSLTFDFGDPCLPTRVEAAPSSPQWVHEIKHDGYRLKVRRTPLGGRISTRCFSPRVFARTIVPASKQTTSVCSLVQQAAHCCLLLTG